MATLAKATITPIVASGSGMRKIEDLLLKYPRVSFPENSSTVLKLHSGMNFEVIKGAFNALSAV